MHIPQAAGPTVEACTQTPARDRPRSDWYRDAPPTEWYRSSPTGVADTIMPAAIDVDSSALPLLLTSTSGEALTLSR